MKLRTNRFVLEGYSEQCQASKTGRFAKIV